MNPWLINVIKIKAKWSDKHSDYIFFRVALQVTEQDIVHSLCGVDWPFAAAFKNPVLTIYNKV